MIQLDVYIILVDEVILVDVEVAVLVWVYVVTDGAMLIEVLVEVVVAVLVLVTVEVRVGHVHEGGTEDEVVNNTWVRNGAKVNLVMEVGVKL